MLRIMLYRSEEKSNRMLNAKWREHSRTYTPSDKKLEQAITWIVQPNIHRTSSTMLIEESVYWITMR